MGHLRCSFLGQERKDTFGQIKGQVVQFKPDPFILE